MSRRTDRINELIREELSWILANEVKDPRLPFLITVLSVEVSGDLRQAKVFVSVMGDATAKTNALTMLQAASGFLHKELKHRLVLRYVPSLFFQMDNSILEGNRMLQFMDDVNSSKENQSEYST